ncbi:MAG: PilT/PilU family type 4a pilus ATPase [Rickettsiales bacterium]|nr:PilT/PilU family type 4a pilus ATPase [Rickettsiales bacterium]MDG4545428.1 PilT/PilU family type 4a pilus ATPase [Rickettsiales bacterium]MDG4547877.1 PilT/PilU family type 4a pilus ATPase [Rickettsiales bacterium]
MHEQTPQMMPSGQGQQGQQPHVATNSATPTVPNGSANGQAMPNATPAAAPQPATVAPQSPAQPPAAPATAPVQQPAESIKVEDSKPPLPDGMLDKIVYYATNFKLSDIHIHSNEPIAIRQHGSIEVQRNDFITDKKIGAFIESILDEDQKEHFQKMRDIDLAIEGGGMRFRVNAYMTLRGPAMVLRKIETEAPDIEKLNLPKAVFDITTQKNGLVLVTGPTGSGKSTTLASIIKKINSTRKENIITIEDPVEFIHESNVALISQREVGKDAFSFGSALKAVLRQDPDVILLGEMRDLETVGLALTAAETGHLVFGTLHTNGAPNSINRILDVFPPAQQAQARSQLSQSIRLVVTQRLIKTADGKGRVAAFEVMKSNAAISNLIREGKIFQIEQTMQTSKGEGNMLMKDSIQTLLDSGKIRKEDLEDAH